MSVDQTIAQTEDGIGWLTFSNPDRHNALTAKMANEAIAILDGFARDPQVRLCVMRGAGQRAFVSGADIGGLSDRSKGTEGSRSGLSGLFSALADFEKPLIAAIRGWCLGGGVAVAMKADIRIAAESARFGIPAARLGVGYPLDSTRDLVNLVGPSAAKIILFTAERISAERALELGLIDEVASNESIETRIAEIAAGIRRNAPLSIKAAKATIDHIARGSPTDEAVNDLIRACLQSRDFKEGRAAFLEKRDPEFRGE